MSKAKRTKKKDEDVLDVGPHKKQWEGTNKWLKGEADRLQLKSDELKKVIELTPLPPEGEKADAHTTSAVVSGVLGMEVYHELANIWTFMRLMALEQIDHRWSIKLDQFMLTQFLKQWKKARPDLKLIETRQDLKRLQNDIAKNKKVFDWYSRFERHKPKAGKDRMDEMFPA